MSLIFASPIENLAAGIAGPLVLGDHSLRGGSVHVIVKRLDLAAQPQLTVADQIDWGGLPKGAVPLFGMLDVSATLGASTLDVGVRVGNTITGVITAAAFKAAGTLTTVDAPQIYMRAAAIGVPLTSPLRLVSAIGAASLPVAGTIAHAIYFTIPHGA